MEHDNIVLKKVLGTQINGLKDYFYFAVISKLIFRCV